MPKCRVGDLAIVIKAQHKRNLGKIVRIIGLDGGNDFVVFRGYKHVWQVECVQRLFWTLGKKRFIRKLGPVPDCRLQPIRGNTTRHGKTSVSKVTRGRILAESKG